MSPMPNLISLIDDLHKHTGNILLSEALGRLIFPVMLATNDQTPDPRKPMKIRYQNAKGDWFGYWLNFHAEEPTPIDPDLASMDTEDIPHPWLIPVIVWPKEEEDE